LEACGTSEGGWVQLEVGAWIKVMMERATMWLIVKLTSSPV